ncbi:MAG: hypothetical protein DRP02_12700 [Candidatus Gerdarchaeota archaeon]|nr:MAG: hypothetical protein DRP02_12700 [Candidatus Gerdarchaeota archaeon]
MLELNEQQQLIENGRLAKDVIENPVFSKLIKGNIDFFTNQLLELEPQDSAAFPIVQGGRKYLMSFLKDLEAVADAGQEAEQGVKKEGGLV